MVGGEPRVGQRQDGESRVPHRGLAGLQPTHLALLDHETLQAADACLHDRMVVRVALQVQGQKGVHPGRLDTAPATVGLLAREHPRDRPVQCEASERLHREPLDAAQARRRGV